jgi:two-component system cell cycle sensor histidine kinase/response regulator CckA
VHHHALIERNPLPCCGQSGPRWLVRFLSRNLFNETGEVQGFFVELLKHVAEKEHWQIEYVHGTWSEGIERLKSGEVDVLTSVAYTEERDEFMTYGKEPLLTVWAEIFVHEQSEIGTVFDLQDKTVAVIKADHNARVFKKNMQSFGVECQFIEMTGVMEILRAVGNKTADAGIVNSTTGVSACDDNPIRGTDIVFNPFPIYFAVLDGENQETTATLERYLAKWRSQKDSVYYQDLRTYMHHDQGVKRIISPLFMEISCFITLLLFVAILFSLFLRHRVKKATQELHASEILYRTLYERTSDAIFLVDENTGQYLDANKAAERLTGRTASELKTLTTRCITPDGADERLKELRGADKTLAFGETVYIRPDKSERTATLQTIPITSNTVFGIAHDITEAKQAERELARSEEQYRMLSENILDVVYSIDETGNITFIGPQISRYGFDPASMLGKPYSHFVVEDDRLRLKKQIEAALATGEDPSPFEFRLLLPNGNTCWMEETRKQQRDESGGITGSIGVLRDISERKIAANSERKLTKRLAEAERRESLGVMAGGVAHDLNNILGPIVLLPEMIAEVLDNFRDATDEEIEEAREDLSIVSDSAKRATETVRDLKSLGRSGSVEGTPLEANKLVADCLGSHDIQALREKHPLVDLKSRRSIKPIIINGDKTSLHRVLLNLVINAIEAVDGRGDVQVELLSVHMQEQTLAYESVPPGNYALIQIRDTGAGIPDDLLYRIFEPFISTKRDDSSTSGSGLGLSVVHAIVKDHGGFIDVTRNADNWSTVFSIYLPVVEGGIELAKREDDGSALTSGREHILIVDDEQAQRFIARRTLEHFGYRVSIAKDGREAVAAFEKEMRLNQPSPFDLVLLDMIMGENFDGLTTLERIRELAPDQRVIIVSGHAPEARGAAALAMQASWVDKPYDVSELIGAVREKLDS